jgi:hypothetical protein
MGDQQSDVPLHAASWDVTSPAGEGAARSPVVSGARPAQPAARKHAPTTEMNECLVPCCMVIVSSMRKGAQNRGFCDKTLDAQQLRRKTIALSCGGEGLTNEDL